MDRSVRNILKASHYRLNNTREIGTDDHDTRGTFVIMDGTRKQTGAAQLLRRSQRRPRSAGETVRETRLSLKQRSKTRVRTFTERFRVSYGIRHLSRAGESRTWATWVLTSLGSIVSFLQRIWRESPISTAISASTRCKKTARAGRPQISASVKLMLVTIFWT